MASLRGRPWGAGGPIHTDARQGREAGRPGGREDPGRAEERSYGARVGHVVERSVLSYCCPVGSLGSVGFFFKPGCNAGTSPRCLLSCPPLFLLG